MRTLELPGLRLRITLLIVINMLLNVPDTLLNASPASKWIDS